MLQAPRLRNPGGELMKRSTLIGVVGIGLSIATLAIMAAQRSTEPTKDDSTTPAAPVKPAVPVKRPVPRRPT